MKAFPYTSDEQLNAEIEHAAQQMLAYWRKHGRIFVPVRSRVSLCVQRACLQIGQQWQGAQS